MMRVVSFLAHEHPASAAISIHNISWAVKPDVLIVHWAASAKRDLDGLVDALANYEFPCRVQINPVALDTSFGNIINAHIANVELALEMGATPQSSIIMHSSNDWYISNAAEYLTQNPYIFQVRPLTAKSVHQFAENPIVAFLNEQFGKCMYSQPEGTSYPVSVFLAAKKTVLDESCAFTDTAAEELLLPTLATYFGIKPTATPTIFSEVIRSELYSIQYWNVFARLGLLKFCRIRKVLRHASVKLSVVTMACSPRLGFTFSTNSQTVRRIRKSELYSIFSLRATHDCGLAIEYGTPWVPYLRGSLYGFKRLPRDPEDVYRLNILEYLDNLSRKA